MTFSEETMKFSNFEVFFSNLYVIYLKFFPNLQIWNGLVVRVFPLEQSSLSLKLDMTDLKPDQPWSL
jgi:hypothetical protein